MPEKKLKIAIITSGAPLARWQAQSLDALLDQGLATIDLWLDIASDTEADLSSLTYARFCLHRRSTALQASPRQADDFCATRHDGVTKDQALHKLNAASVDLAVNFSDLPFDDVASPTAHGICCFIDSETRPLPSLLPYTHDFISDAEVLALHVGVHKGAQEGVRILASAQTPVWRHSHRRSADMALESASILLRRACMSILHDAGSTPRPLGVTPPLGAIDVSAAIVKQVWRKFLIPFAFMRDLTRLEIWNIALVNQPWREWVEKPDPSGAQWLPDPGQERAIADPFAWIDDDGVHLLAEDMDYRTSKGTIIQAALPSFDAWPPSLHPAIERDAHLSYPALFFHDATAHITPESYEAGKVSLFKATPSEPRDDKPARHNWVEDGVVMDAIAGVDPIVFKHDDRWWLFCTDQDDGPNHKLKAWLSDTHLGPWQAHPMNPIVIDIRSARGAGPMIEHEGRLYRPGQDCSHTYGGALSIHEIIKLTPDEYVEKPAWRMTPDAQGAYPDGLHTICPVGERCLIDGKRYSIRLSNVFLKIRNGFINRKRRKRAKARN